MSHASHRRGCRCCLDTQHVTSRSVTALLALVGLAAALAAGCSERSEPTGDLVAAYPVTVAGLSEGEPLILETRPERIVALDAGSAELVDALGAGGRLVGVPAGVSLGADVTPAVVVKPNGQADVDAVTALEPDLIIATQGTDRIALSQVAREAEAPLYLQPSRSVEDVLLATIELGFLLGEPAAARQLVGELKGGIAAVEARLEAVEAVTVFVDTGFFITVPDESLLGDLVLRGRGVNIAGDAAGLGPFPATELQAADPDVYLTTSESGVTLDTLSRNARTQDLTAVTGGRVVVVPTEFVTRPGPNVARGLESVAAALHPDAFR